MHLLFSVACLFALQTAVAEYPGVCTVAHVVQTYRYVMDRTKQTWIHEKYNYTTQRNECCSGYETKFLDRLVCSPICDPPCDNSICMAPDTCVCHPRHVMINNSSSSCIEVCDACINGRCLQTYDEECTCELGYKRDPESPHICDPVCDPECVNAACSAPEVCQCHPGYKPHSDKPGEHVCDPICKQECIFGMCTEPDVCSCFEGYINDEESPSICLPVCNNTCINGDCYAPDMCKCHQGFQLHPEDPYHCVPNIPEDSSLNYCVLSLPQAIKYDSGSDCFLMENKITLSVPPDCRVLESQAGSFCSQPNYCHSNQCVLNFRCSAKKLNGSNEIHCNLDNEDFETDSANVEYLTNTTGWTDVVLVISSYRYLNTSIEIKQNRTKHWLLQPLGKGPVCGKMHFGVEMSECGFPMTSSEVKDHINSSFIFWMNGVLIGGFLLLVTAGVGGFLWARHRRLNDPLNYRGDMTRGYRNDTYGNHQDELVSDDESDRYSDAPL